VAAIAIACSACAPALPELASGVSVARFQPGRFSGEATVAGEGGCSQTHVSSSRRTTLAITLAVGGRATTCRTLENHAIYDGGGDAPEVRDESEQRGLSGRWRARGPWIEVTLAPDARVCPSLAGRKWKTEEPWRLECLPVTVERRALLACRFDGPGADTFFTVGGVIAREHYFGDDWLLVAPAPGVKVSAFERWHVSMSHWVTSLTDP
jgi:hypothetical protein